MECEKMKKIIITTIISTFLFSMPTTTTLNIEGMTCASGCAPKVNKAAMEIEGVQSCDVNFIDSKAVITYDNEKVSASNILEALKTSTTFKYNLNKDINTSSEATCDSKKACCNKTKQNEKKSFIQRLFGF
tara:strand:- start:77 stop:469 length:393 start_codon:yes stop_codon:yes gene_type:complete